MNKIVLAGTSLTLLLVTAQPTYALDIQVQPGGTIHFFSNTVLGDSTIGAAVDAGQPNRIIPSQNQQEVRVKTNEGHLRIETMDRNANSNSNSKPTYSDEAPRVNITYPTQKTPTQQRIMRDEVQSDPSQMNRVYIEQLEEKRLERKDEALEIRSRYDAQNNPELELRTQAASARLKGAEFSFDQATNQVKIVTPSGEEHVLNHLPDQAWDRIRTAQQTTDLALEEENLEVSAAADGKVLYKTKAFTTKRFLGLFPQTIEKEVVLEDGSGQVTTEEKVPDSFLGRIMYSLSF